MLVDTRVVKSVDSTVGKRVEWMADRMVDWKGYRSEAKRVDKKVD